MSVVSNESEVFNVRMTPKKDDTIGIQVASIEGAKVYSYFMARKPMNPIDGMGGESTATMSRKSLGNLIKQLTECYNNLGGDHESE